MPHIFFLDYSENTFTIGKQKSCESCTLRKYHEQKLCIRQDSIYPSIPAREYSKEQEILEESGGGRSMW